MTFTWIAREPPLRPTAVLARESARTALLERLCRCDDGALAQLSGVVSPELVVLCGASDALPWVDGAVWLGTDAAAPALRLPTTTKPDLPAALLERAVLARTSGRLAAIVPGTIVALDEARPLARAVLERWRAR